MPPDPRSLRLFVAVELPAAIRRELDAVAAALLPHCPAGALRWVRPEGIHVTLKFLGAVDPARVEAINTALRLGLAGQRAFRLRPGALGSFGGRRNLRVVWVGVDGDTARLTDLAAAVERAFVPLGFPTEQLALNAHLTLARVRDDAPPADRRRIAAAIDGFAAPPFTAFPVERVSLMRSTLGPGGARYDALSAFPLGPATID